MTERTSGTRQADEWIRVAESALGLGFWSWDVPSARLLSSAGLHALFGINAASMHIDLAFLESLVHPKDRLTTDDAHGLATDSRQANRRLRVIRPDGQLRWLHGQASSFFDRNGALSRVVGVFTDITDQQELQRRAKAQRALLHNVAQLIDGALWIADEDGRLVDRIHAEDDSERPLLEEVGTNWRLGTHPDDLERMPEIWRAAVERKSPYRFSPRLRFADGSYHQFHTVGLPFSSDFSAEPYWGGISTRSPRAFAQNDDLTDDDGPLTPAQVRACRALLNWTAEVLAQRAGISVSTVRRIESADGQYTQGDSLRLVTLAFREAGLTITRGPDGRFCVTDAS